MGVHQTFSNKKPGSLKGDSEGYKIGEYPSDKFDPIFIAADRYEEKEEPVDNIHLLNSKVMSERMPSLFPSFKELCWLDLSRCQSLSSLPNDLYKLKLLRRLYLNGCDNLEELPEIEETMENLTVLILDRTAIKKLPSSLHRLVGLEELSLRMCAGLEIIPSSIGSLSKLCKLDLAFCDSLETLPSSIFKLKLTKLDLYGCSMLRTFPEILEPAESFVRIDLVATAIKELPSSLDHLVGLRTLRLKRCNDLVSLPNSIANLNLLSELDCSGCARLTEIPNDIGRLSSLRMLLLQESGVVNLPESIAHLSSLKSLDLSDCEKLECIPQPPPFLKQLLAFDCPSIRRVTSNSRLKLLPLDSKEGTFKFHFTNSEELDASAHSNIVAEAWLRFTEDAYRCVFFCFPGSTVPRWLPYHCLGYSITMKRDSLNWCNDKRLIGFALCVVLGRADMDDTGTGRSVFTYRLTFDSDGRTYFLPNRDELRNFFRWNGRERFVIQDHTFVWKYQLDFPRMHNRLFHVHSYTFEISKHDINLPYMPRCAHPHVTVKGCGICPLYTKEKDDNGGFLRFLNSDDIEEPSGSKSAS